MCNKDILKSLLVCNSEENHHETRSIIYDILNNENYLKLIETHRV